MTEMGVPESEVLGFHPAVTSPLRLSLSSPTLSSLVCSMGPVHWPLLRAVGI